MPLLTALGEIPKILGTCASADRRQCLGKISMQGLLSFGRADHAED